MTRMVKWATKFALKNRIHLKIEFQVLTHYQKLFLLSTSATNYVRSF